LAFSIHISTLDNPDEHVPERHWFHKERITWFDVADNLPRYQGFNYDSDVDRKGPTHDDLPD
jgi:hypothetical protein